jgi:hypothetical protein
MGNGVSLNKFQNIKKRKEDDKSLSVKTLLRLKTGCQTDKNDEVSITS